jgi:hypothetical protein
MLLFDIGLSSIAILCLAAVIYFFGKVCRFMQYGREGFLQFILTVISTAIVIALTAISTYTIFAYAHKYIGPYIFR